MTSTIREVLYSVRHRGCPVSDASAATPGVHVSTVSKIEKEDKRLESLLYLDGDDADVATFVDALDAHERRTNVRPFTTENGGGGRYVVLTVDYDDTLPSIASVFSKYDCFQPTTITVEGGFENWPVYHEESVDISSVTDHFEDNGMPFEVRRNVEANALPGAQLAVTGNESTGLTDRQLEVLTVARRMGYYEADVDVTMADIADRMELSSATVCEHLNRAENHVISTAVDAVSPDTRGLTDRSVRTAPDGSP